MSCVMRGDDDENQALSTARNIAAAPEDEIARTVARLRRSKRLFMTVHGLNKLLSVPEHRGVAVQALKRMGLDRAG
jgi:hypothetical protein